MKNGQYRAHLPRILYGRGSHFWAQFQCRFNLSAGVRVRVGRGYSGLFAEQPGHLFNRVSRRFKPENALGRVAFCASHGGRIAVFTVPYLPCGRNVPGTIDWPIAAGHIAIITSRNARYAYRHSSGIVTGKTPFSRLDSSSCRQKASIASTKFFIRWGRRHGRNFQNIIGIVENIGPVFP